MSLQALRELFENVNADVACDVIAGYSPPFSSFLEPGHNQHWSLIVSEERSAVKMSLLPSSHTLLPTSLDLEPCNDVP